MEPLLFRSYYEIEVPKSSEFPFSRFHVLWFTLYDIIYESYHNGITIRERKVKSRHNVDRDPIKLFSLFNLISKFVEDEIFFQRKINPLPFLLNDDIEHAQLDSLAEDFLDDCPF